MKTCLLSLFFWIFLWTNYITAQTVYSTKANGNFSDNTTWNTTAPPSPLRAGDSIIISNDVILDVSLEVQGVMIISASGSLIANGKRSIKVGRGAINTGEFYNYGYLSIVDLEVKPDNGCVETRGLPHIHNFGTMDITDDLHVGNNCGAGSFFNYVGAKVNIADQIHLDYYICNQDTMVVGNLLKVHGGIIDCCGYFDVPLLDIDANPSGRSGSLECVDFCTASGLEPEIDVAGVVYADLNDAYSSAPAADIAIDDDSTYICGTNQAGNSLPIQLLEFNATVIENRYVQLDWATASEFNNEAFIVEKSLNLQDWEQVATVEGALFSNERLDYQVMDNNASTGHSYYRLTQLDIDGQSTTFDVIAVYINPIGRELSFFPNPVITNLQINAAKAEYENFKIYNHLGAELTHHVRVVTQQNNYCIIDCTALGNGMYHLVSQHHAVAFVKK